MADSIRGVAILGVGLIGGSIGLSLRSQGVPVFGIGRDPSRLELARSLGAIDQGVTEAAKILAEVDVAVVCTPVDRVARDSLELARHGPPHLLVTDAGSAKRAIVEAVEADPNGRLAFVGAHPIAGSERQGVENARAELFQGRVCVLTPTERTPNERLERARLFWSRLGFRIVEIDPAEHDRRLALTSHLPHVVASAVASLIPPELLSTAAGAYRDITRVAAADAALWASIFLENSGNLRSAIDALRERLDRFDEALASDDADRIREWWDVGRRLRLEYDPENPRKSVAVNELRV